MWTPEKITSWQTAKQVLDRLFLCSTVAVVVAAVRTAHAVAKSAGDDDRMMW